MTNKSVKFSLVGLVSLAIMVTLSVEAHDTEGKDLELTGEVIDLQCYMAHPDNGAGEEHIGCAKAFINLGFPIGLLDEDGKVFLLLSAGHKSLKNEMVPFTGRKVSVLATLLEQNGIQALQVKKIEAAD